MTLKHEKTKQMLHLLWYVLLWLHFKTFDEKLNNWKNPLEILLTKKRLAMNAIAISNFLKAIDPYKKDNTIQIKLWKIWVCYVKKLFAHLICWNYLVETYNNVVMLLYCFPFQKNL